MTQFATSLNSYFDEESWNLDSASRSSLYTVQPSWYSVGSIESFDLKDYYKLDVIAGYTYTVILTSDSAYFWDTYTTSSYLEFDISDSLGNILLSSTPDYSYGDLTTDTLTFNANVSGTYYVDIHSSIFGQSADYAVTVTQTYTNTQNNNAATFSKVSYSGALTDSQTISVSASIFDADVVGGVPSSTYTWFRLVDQNGVIYRDTGWQVSDQITLAQQDVGLTLIFQIGFIDDFGNVEESGWYTTGSVIFNTNDSPNGSVTIDGTATEGQELTAVTTGITDADGLANATFTYQWQRDNTDISGASSSTYTLTQDDVGSSVSVVVSYTDDLGTSESIESAATNAVTNVNNTAGGSVTINGTATEGQELTAVTTGITDADGLANATFTYQWQRDNTDISGASSSAYTLTQDDVGSSVSVVVSYTDDLGASESIKSSATSAVTNVNNIPTGDVSISGKTMHGETLTAENTLADTDGLGSISYQWFRDDIAVSSTTPNTYNLTQDDIGSKFKVTATYIDAQGTAELVSSATTSAVVDLNYTPVFTSDNGTVVTSVHLLSDKAYGVNTQADGKILVVGSSSSSQLLSGTGDDFSIIRYNVDGSLDTSFGTAGFATIDLSYQDYGRHVHILADGKILVIGQSQIGSYGAPTLLRLNSDGSLDSTFGDNGSVVTDLGTYWDQIVDAKIQADDKIVVLSMSAPAGDFYERDAYIIRYNADGTLDTSFGGIGYVSTSLGPNANSSDTPYSLLLQSDGKIVISGTADSAQGTNYDDIALIRYNSNGIIDTAFGADGIVYTDFGFNDYGYGSALQSDGKILVLTSGGRLIRYNTDGSLDPSFADNGVVSGVGTGATEIALQSDGKIILASGGFKVTRYGSEGVLDTTFGVDGWFIEQSLPAGATLNSLEVQNDDSVLLAGYYTDVNGQKKSVVTYLNSDGTPNASFSSNTLDNTVSFTENGTAIILDQDVRVFDVELALSGTYSGATLRLARNGGANSDDAFGKYSTWFGIEELVEGASLTNASGTVLGVITKNSGGELILTFNANATEPLVNSMIQSLTYKNTSDAPPSSVKIDWTFNDQDGGTAGDGGAQSVTGSTTVNITPINDPLTGGVTLTGSASQGQTLTVSNNLADLDGIGEITYQWNANGNVIDGATSDSYRLVQSDVGDVISVTASYTDNYGTLESKTSGSTWAVLNINDAPTGSVTITGTATQGQTLTASNTLADVDGLGTISYQWNRDGNAITGATASTYVLGQSDVDATITVTASYTDDYGTDESVTSLATDPVVNGNDLPTGSLLINLASTNTPQTFGEPIALDALPSTMTVLADGSWVTLWSNSSSSSADIYARVYSSDGQAQSSVITVNTTTDGRQRDPSVTAMADGGWLVTWSSTNADATETAVYAQKFDATGTAIGSETKIYSQTGYFTSFYYPDTSVAVLTDGGWIITYTAYSTGSDSSNRGVYAIQYGADGVALGSPFLVNTTTLYDQYKQSVTALDDGGYVVAWYSGSQYGIYAQRFDATGSKVGGEIQVSGADGANGNYGPAITTLKDGGWIAVWVDRTSPYEVVGQRFDSDSNKVGTEFIIGPTSGLGMGVTALADGGWLVTWSNNDQLTQRFDASGQKVGDVIAMGPGSSIVVQLDDGSWAMAQTVDGQAQLQRYTAYAQGDVLTADSSSIVDIDGIASIDGYQWYSNGIAITGATTDTLTLTQDEVGTDVYARVTYTDGFGAVESVNSSVGYVANINDIPTGSVTISGSPTQGETLTVSHTLADIDGLGSVSYQWYRDDIAVESRTPDTYVLTQDDVGSIFKVTASYVDAQGTAESVTSVTTSAVANINDAPTFDIQDGLLNLDQEIRYAEFFNENILLASSSEIFSLDSAGTLSKWGIGTDALHSNFSIRGLFVANSGKLQIYGYDSDKSDFAVITVGNDGVLETSSSTNYYGGRASVERSDGSLLELSTIRASSYSDTDFKIAKYTPAGILDTSFGGIGYITLNYGPENSPDRPIALIEQLDGRLIVVGTSYFTTGGGRGDVVVSRLLSNGIIDTSFGSNGTASIDIASNDDTYGAVQLLNNKLLIATSSGLLRLNSDGSVDTTYGDSGVTAVPHSIKYMHSLDNGQVLLTGPTAASRYLADGTLDNSYGDNGTATFEVPFVYQFFEISRAGPDGELVLGGTYNQTYLDETTSQYKGVLKSAAIRLDSEGNVILEGASTLNQTPVFTEDDVAVILEGSVRIYDLDLATSGSYAGATLKLEREGSANTEDVFSLYSGQVTLNEGGDLSVTDLDSNRQVIDVTIGTVTQNSNGTLILTFGSNATQERVDQIVQNISYVNTSDAPPSTVKINWEFNDKDGGFASLEGEQSVNGSTIVTITPVNDAPTGGVVLSGSASQGQVLTASNTLADADGIATDIVYQWFGDGVAIDGAASSTYLLDQDDVGIKFSVSAGYTDNYGTYESKTTGETWATLNVNDAPTGSVTITGTATQGQTLTASNTLADVDGLGTITYQWKRDDVAITDATNSTYLLTQDDVDSKITVTASYTDDYNTDESVTSSATTTVQNINDNPTGSVSITGTATQGQTLTASNTLADVDGLGTITYQWKRDDVAITDATNSTYVLIQDDVDSKITVTASYTDDYNTDESVTSSATTTVQNINDNPTGSVSITGTATQGQTLTASNTLADVDGLGTITYQWKRDDVAITDATNSTYVLTQDDIGSSISVTASYEDNFGTSESLRSEPIEVENPFTDTISGHIYHWSSHELLPDVDILMLSELHNQKSSPFILSNLRSESAGTNVVDVLFNGEGIQTKSIDLTLSFDQTLSGNFVWDNGLTADGWQTHVNQAGSYIDISGFNFSEVVTGTLLLGSLTLTGDDADSFTVELLDGLTSVSGVETAHSDQTAGLVPYAFTTDADGGFEGEINNQLDYTLSASRNITSTETGRVISAADALAALKIAVGINPNAGEEVSPYQLLSADVNQDGRVSAADALSILKMAVGLAGAPEREWLFVNEAEDFNNADGSVFSRSKIEWETLDELRDSGESNLVAMLAGDVNGSWSGGDTGLSQLPNTYFTDLEATGFAPAEQWWVV